MKQFKFDVHDVDIAREIEEFLDKMKENNREFRKDVFIRALKREMRIQNGDTIEVDSKEYREILESQNLNCKKNNHCTKVQELEEILKRKARSHEDLYMFSKKDIVKIAIKMFDCCLKTGYNYVNELVHKGIIIEAPIEEQAIYNRKHRKQGERRINVYCLKEDLNNKKNKLSYSQIKEEMPIKLEKAII